TPSASAISRCRKGSRPTPIPKSRSSSDSRRGSRSPSRRPRAKRAKQPRAKRPPRKPTAAAVAATPLAAKPKADDIPADFLVVGLGNPGGDFDRSRHNSGADTVALLARRYGASLKLDRRARALAGNASVSGHGVALAFPQTYYNDSGIAVLTLAKR